MTAKNKLEGIRLSYSYLMLLTVACVAVWVSLSTSKDFPFTLAALTAVVCFFWGFAAAPWVVQLFIVVMLMRLDKFYLPKQQRFERNWDVLTQKWILGEVRLHFVAHLISALSFCPISKLVLKLWTLALVALINCYATLVTVEFIGFAPIAGRKCQIFLRCWQTGTNESSN